MKRFALLLAAGVLWLFVAALPAFADGGPHIMSVNSGTTALNGDCASCHRAHTAQAKDILTAAMPALCTNCHNGTKATTDVIDGVQFTPGSLLASNSNTIGGTNTALSSYSTVLGALRGGGFSYALMSTPNRLVTGGQYLLTITSATGTFDLTLTSDGVAGTVTIAATDYDTAAHLQAAIFAASAAPFQNSVPNATYSGSGASNMSNTTTYNVTVTGNNGGPYTLKLQNQLRTKSQSLTIGNFTGGFAGTVAFNDPMYSGNFLADVPVAATGTATTSMHYGTGTVWGNGAVVQAPGSNVGVANAVLDCASCHNPHGNGQYRILNTTPGEDWATTNPTFAVSNTAGVEVAEVNPVVLSAGQTRNYTVSGSSDGLTTGVTWAYTKGDYWRHNYDPSGTTNFTNLYLGLDPMNTGWNGYNAVNAAAVLVRTTLGTAALAGDTTITVASLPASPNNFPTSGNFVVQVDQEQMNVTAGQGTTTWTVTRGYNGTVAVAHASGATVLKALQNSTGLLTAWCIQCHTRYNGYLVDSNGNETSNPYGTGPQLIAQQPADAIFMFKHGTVRYGCEQCHVSHGSNASMDSLSSVNWPGQPLTQSDSDSRLLKVANRGTCQLCHDPTGTVVPGTATGTIPGSIVGAP